MIQQACQEVVTVAEACEVHLSEDILARNMELLDSLPASATTSLQRDLMEGYPSELDAQAGVMVRLGETTRTAVPLHRVLYHSLLPMEMKARGQIVFPA
jgi:2-dehydropantoate 2-reductase